MTKLRSQLEQVIQDSLNKHILPVKTERGILVGSVLIESEGTIKHILRKDQYIYKNISLNVTAIKIANLMAKQRHSRQADQLYKLDQEYSKWFVDSQILLKNYHSAIKRQDYDRADMLWARYYESRMKAMYAKTSVESLASF